MTLNGKKAYIITGKQNVIYWMRNVRLMLLTHMLSIVENDVESISFPGLPFPNPKADSGC